MMAAVLPSLQAPGPANLPVPGFFLDIAMAITKIIGILLIAAGALGLLYGGFTYTKDTHSAKLGSLVLKVQEKETVYVPIIVSAGAIALGVFLLVAFRNK
jgi:TRAP-type C4-dicarboxylate transport system permease small subunit